MKRPAFTQHHLAKFTGTQPMKTLGNIKRKHRARLQRQSGAGFTLIELLIVAALFSLTALLATTVFSNIQSTQRGISSQQRATADGRYVLETIAQSIRTGTINYAREDLVNPYSYVLSSPAADNTLSTIDAVGQVTCYRLRSAKVEVLPDATVNCELKLGGTDWTAFTPGDLVVETLRFYITPVSDPNRPVPRIDTDCKTNSQFSSPLGACTCTVDDNCFTDQTCTTTVAEIVSPPTPAVQICTNPNIQPQVTIFLKSRTASAGPGEQAEVTLQTTVVSRVYQR